MPGVAVTTHHVVSVPTPTLYMDKSATYHPPDTVPAWVLGPLMAVLAFETLDD